jgi:hypothetical protein
LEGGRRSTEAEDVDDGGRVVGGSGGVEGEIDCAAGDDTRGVVVQGGERRQTMQVVPEPGLVEYVVGRMVRRGLRPGVVFDGREFVTVDVDVDGEEVGAEEVMCEGGRSVLGADEVFCYGGGEDAEVGLRQGEVDEITNGVGRGCVWDLEDGGEVTERLQGRSGVGRMKGRNE